DEAEEREQRTDRLELRVAGESGGRKVGRGAAVAMGLVHWLGDGRLHRRDLRKRAQVRVHAVEVPELVWHREGTLRHGLGDEWVYEVAAHHRDCTAQAAHAVVDNFSGNLVGLD